MSDCVILVTLIPDTVCLVTLISVSVCQVTWCATILPFAPSIQDLPQLKAFQMSGPEFNLNCSLNLHNIPTVTYKWFFSKGTSIFLGVNSHLSFYLK